MRTDLQSLKMIGVPQTKNRWRLGLGRTTVQANNSMQRAALRAAADAGRWADEDGTTGDRE